MKEQILYTTRDRETILDENSISHHRVYLKHFYHDDILQKTELFHRDRIIDIKVYLYDHYLTDEEILFKNIYVNGVTIIRGKMSGHEKVFHEKHYVRLQKEKEIIKVEDSSGRIVSVCYINKEEYYHSKTIYADQGEKLKLDYFSHGTPVLKRTEIRNRLLEFSKLHDLEVQIPYYLSFFPFVTSGEMFETESCKYFSEFNDDKEITLQQAFFKRDFVKKIYKKGILQRIEYFTGLEISSKKYFIYDGKSFSLPPENVEINTSLYYLEENKNGFTKWRTEFYEKNIVKEKETIVYDILNKEIFRQTHNLENKTIHVSKKAYYNGEYSPYETFFYDETGKMISEQVSIDDGWHGEEIEISELKIKGFFDHSYGKYFRAASPEIPEPNHPITAYHVVYKNHLGEVIDKNEAGELYEYSEEIFENHQLKKRIIFKADSRKEFKEKAHQRYEESYHDEVKAIPDLESFHTGRNIIYYNKRDENNYILYDFIIRDDEFWNQIKYTGTVVYDNYQRVVSKVTYNGISQQLISGIKIHYSHISPLLENKLIIVNFNDRGEAVSYIDNSIGYRQYSRERYEKEYFFNINPVNNEYYRNLKKLIPPKPAFPFIDFEYDTIRFSTEDEREHEAQLLLSQSKVKVAWLGSYTFYYFLENENDIEAYSRSLSTEYGATYFYNIRKNVSTIETRYSTSGGIEAYLTIDLLSGKIFCEIANNDKYNQKLSFRLIDESDRTDQYCFFYEDKWISDTVMYSELIIELLSKA
ncbi:hypothetical protein CHRYSEOSP005_31620 [Chryseobacterium sp. Alg-005]|uniref:hypothetical protein n=1 Tax=Chryseobacterium sp. Alg-005 TaxID=3159516 RepID=UPI003555BA87